MGQTISNLRNLTEVLEQRPLFRFSVVGLKPFPRGGKKRGASLARFDEISLGASEPAEGVVERNLQLFFGSTRRVAARRRAVWAAVVHARQLTVESDNNSDGRKSAKTSL